MKRLVLSFATLAMCGAAQAGPALAHCSWDRPGLRPFMGDVAAAVDRYTDIPYEVRARLKARMAERDFDEFVTIERDAIVGRRQYEAGIREMHFGDGRVCNVVTRSKWSAQMRERGLVYCEQDHCILVPTVCRNVSRITRLAVAAPPTDDVPPGLPQEGGGYASAGWIMAQARATQEPGWVAGHSPSVLPPVPFMPPYSGGIGEVALPVPEAPAWLMWSVGALLIAGARRRRFAST